MNGLGFKRGLQKWILQTISVILKTPTAGGYKSYKAVRKTEIK